MRVPLLDRRILVVVESVIDRLLIARLAGRLIDDLDPDAGPLPNRRFPDLGIDVVAAAGFAALPRTAAALMDAVRGSEPRVLAGTAIVADGDDQRRLELMADESIRGWNVEVIVASPSIASAWLGVEPMRVRNAADAIAHIDRLDLNDLQCFEPSFHQFRQFLVFAAEGL